MREAKRTRQNLIFDADDTLWENNIYYEEVRDKFLALTDSLGVSRVHVESKIDETEQKNIKLYGYGSENFIRSLKETYQFFSKDHDHLDHTLKQIHSFGAKLFDFHVELLPAVAETLSVLQGRHRFFLLTKGNRKEQLSKVKKSHLEGLFERMIVVDEKNAATYKRIVQKWKIDKSITWMIGNSPRSDINPALEAGLGAVFVPHPVTWHFEKVPLRTDLPRLIKLQQFSDLLSHF